MRGGIVSVALRADPFAADHRAKIGRGIRLQIRRSAPPSRFIAWSGSFYNVGNQRAPIAKFGDQ
jgi:hypothetical protein